LNEGIVDLLEHRTDVAIRIGRLKDSTLHARPIASSGLRVLASPAYLAVHGSPRTAAELARHSLLGFTQPDSLNDWPLRDEDQGELHIRPTLAAASGETLRQLALAGQGIVCLSDFMTREDRRSGRLVQLLPEETLEVRQSINAVYYRNTALSSRIASFLDYLVECVGEEGFED
jgi:DNA-binding transcriptional LysR family regulator